MKKIFGKLFLAIAALLAFGLAAASCGKDDAKKAYDHLVTFNYNVGTLDANCPDQMLGVSDNSLVGIQPGFSDSFKEQQIVGYYNEGWYLPETDENGEPVVGEDQRVKLDKKWDFAKDRVSSDVTLYANLRLKPVLTVVVEGGENIEYTAKPGALRNEPPAALAPKKEGYTFYGYYEDEDCTQEFTWPYRFTSENKTVYTKFIPGTWTIVKDAAAFNKAMAANPKAKIYVDNDIDFSDTAWVYGMEFNGEINGNRHVFTGIECSFEANKKTTTNFGLFGVLGAKAHIYDLTIKNARAVFSDSYVSVEYKAALFAWKAEAGAVLENITVDGSLSRGDMSAGSVVELSPFIAIDGSATVKNCRYEDVIVG